MCGGAGREGRSARNWTGQGFISDSVLRTEVGVRIVENPKNELEEPRVDGKTDRTW